MHSNIEILKILIIEDDQFKLDSVTRFIKNELNRPVEISFCTALSTALHALKENKYHVVIIDMSLPSHPPVAGQGSPMPLLSGGLDIIFEIDALGYNCTSIVLTQYPELEIDGAFIPISEAAEEIAIKFGIHIHACLQYFEDSFEWKHTIKKILGKE
jgi:ActR/RegA family two-component response regulator